MQGCSFLLFLNYSYVLCVCVEYTVILEAAAAAATPTSSAAASVAAATVQHVLPAASFCYR